MKIVIVEDDAGISFLQQEILTEKGHEVEWFDTAKDLIEYLDSNHPDLIVLDYSLPDMNGYELIKFLDEKNKRMPPFIVATGQGDERVAVKMMKSGARDYIVKDAGFLDILSELVDRVIKDISNENELQRMEALHRELFDSISMELLYVNENMEIQMVNKEIQKKFNHVESFFKGKKCFEIFSKEIGCDCDGCPGKMTLSDGLPHEITIRNQIKKEIYLIRTFPVSDKKENKVNGFILMNENITEKINLENELSHARKMESLGQLAGGIAHDFNNMLAGIMGAVDVIRYKRQHTPEIEKFLDIITKTSVRAADLTSKLLYFSRKSEKKINKINLHNLIEETITLLERSAHKNIIFQKDFKAEHFYISGDESQLQNVILNIGINGCHAMPKGGDLFFITDNIQIRGGDKISLPDDIPDGNYLQLTIKDKGCGIPRENLDKIFEPFFTTKKEGEGTGLGLSAAYGIVRDHHGFITVQSVVNEGTRFLICLPVSGALVPSRSAVEAKKGRGTILFVDDEEIIRMTMNDILTYLGYNVLLAKNGNEAIALFIEQKEKIDLVILDIIMPEMDGKETFIRLKELNPKVKVIISSGYTKTIDLDELNNYGDFEFISKPYQNSELSHRIADLIDRQS
ncbi:MAG: response regulator [Candidatus Marinimicrobia bacterium]|nr:response regulator [Candidatus Neomarinimicrobiota bacterium]